MRRASWLIVSCAISFCLVAGCESLGLSPPAHKLLDSAKDIRDTAPVPAPVARELSKELLPPHIIQPGDSLIIQPIQLDTPLRLPPDQTVQQDGTIDLARYGRPVVVGKSIPQLEAELSALIKDDDQKAIALTIRLTGKPSSVYYVFGEVNAPGAYPISGRETVMDGVVAAGGLTRKASTENIILSRPTTPEGCRLVYPVCWPQIVQLGDTTTNYQLLPGDRIYVPSQGLLESILPKKCLQLSPACQHPQASCYGSANSGGCGAGQCGAATPNSPAPAAHGNATPYHPSVSPAASAAHAVTPRPSPSPDVTATPPGVTMLPLPTALPEHPTIPAPVVEIPTMPGNGETLPMMSLPPLPTKQQ